MNSIYGDELYCSTEALMKVYEGIKHTDISEEFILPDYLPDIKKIIRVDTTPKIDGKFVTKGKVDYEGDVVVNILFIDEGNHLRTVTFTVSFADGVEIDGVVDECIANLVPDPESVICKMVNPRRVSIRMRMDTSVTVWCTRCFEPDYSGEGASGRIEKAERSIEVMKLVCAGESGLSASADLEADGALPQIGEVISCNVDMSFYECKGADGKVLCRGDMPITVFYSSPSDSGEVYTVLYRKLPLAQVVLAEGIEDDYTCMARGSVDSVNVNVAENGFGERRIVELDITYRIYLNCVGKDKVNVVSDVYALGKNVKIETENTTFCRLSRLFSRSFSVSLAQTRAELNISDADGVFAVKADPKILSVEKKAENGSVLVSGNAKVSAIVKGKDGLTAFDYEMPFSTELDGGGVGKDFIYNCDTVCMSAKGRFDSENFYTELELALNMMILETESAEVMKRAEFTDMETVAEAPQMRFYYPDENETLWSIGKRFGVPISELEETNGISDGKLPYVLYIPS